MWLGGTLLISTTRGLSNLPWLLGQQILAYIQALTESDFARFTQRSSNHTIGGEGPFNFPSNKSTRKSAQSKQGKPVWVVVFGGDPLVGGRFSGKPKENQRATSHSRR